MLTMNQVKETLMKYGNLSFEDEDDEKFKIRVRTGRVEIYVSITEYDAYLSIDRELLGRKTIVISELTKYNKIEDIDKWVKINLKRIKKA